MSPELLAAHKIIADSSPGEPSETEIRRLNKLYRFAISHTRDTADDYDDLYRLASWLDRWDPIAQDLLRKNEVANARLRAIR